MKLINVKRTDEERKAKNTHKKENEEANVFSGKNTTFVRNMNMGSLTLWPMAKLKWHFAGKSVNDFSLDSVYAWSGTKTLVIEIEICLFFVTYFIN